MFGVAYSVANGITDRPEVHRIGICWPHRRGPVAAPALLSSGLWQTRGDIAGAVAVITESELGVESERGSENALG